MLPKALPSGDMCCKGVYMPQLSPLSSLYAAEGFAKVVYMPPSCIYAAKGSAQGAYMLPSIEIEKIIANLKDIIMITVYENLTHAAV